MPAATEARCVFLAAAHHAASLDAGRLAGAVVALSPPSTLDVDRLVRQLGSDRFTEREAASKKLEAVGERALPALLEVAKKSNDLELRRREEDILGTARGRGEARRARQRLGKWWMVAGTWQGRRTGLHAVGIAFGGERFRNGETEGVFTVHAALNARSAFGLSPRLSRMQPG